jgi:ribosomal-protein-alanine N-acetyltransferase
VELMRFRKMSKADLPRVLEIEGQGYNYPWKAPIFNDCLNAAHYDCWVCEDTEDKITAYCIVSTAVGEATVLNLCIDPVIRKQGLGRKFMQHVIDTALPFDLQNAWQICLAHFTKTHQFHLI